MFQLNREEFGQRKPNPYPREGVRKTLNEDGSFVGH